MIIRTNEPCKNASGDVLSNFADIRKIVDVAFVLGFYVFCP